MKKTIINACMLGLGTLTLASCSEPMDEITSLIVGRDFSPTNFEAKSVTKESAQLQWTLSQGAASYNLEIFQDDSLTFAGTPTKTYTGISASQIPFLVEGLVYDTKYSARVMAIDEKDASRNSVWNGVYFRTSPQQIFNAVDPLKDVLDRSVKMSWSAGEEVTKIVVKYTDDKGNVSVVTTHEITAEEKEEGKATVTGLNPSTKYSVYLYNGEKERGSKVINTITDLNGKTVVEEGEDLKSILSKATEGEVFVLMPGTYQIPSADEDGTTSAVALKANVSIQGLYPSAKPVIQGRFEINGATSVELDNVILDGSLNNSTDQAFNFKQKGDLEKLVVKNSEIKNFGKGLYYINVAAKVGEITFNNCDIHDIECDGGDFLDCRKGYIGALNLINCTFYNSCAARDFIRYDNAKLDKETVITVNHCTIDGISNTKGKRLLYVRNGCSKIVWSNNIVTNTLAVWSNQSSTTVPEFSNNVYNACANLNTVVWADGKGDNAFNDGSATVLDPKYKNAAKGDFTVGNEAVSKLKVGAEKWYAAE